MKGHILRRLFTSLSLKAVTQDPLKVQVLLCQIQIRHEQQINAQNKLDFSRKGFFSNATGTPYSIWGWQQNHSSSNPNTSYDSLIVCELAICSSSNTFRSTKQTCSLEQLNGHEHDFKNSCRGINKYNFNMRPTITQCRFRA